MIIIECTIKFYPSHYPIECGGWVASGISQIRYRNYTMYILLLALKLDKLG